MVETAHQSASDIAPLVIAPDEIVHYLREQWLSDIEAGIGTIADTVLPYLEAEAIKRFSVEWTAPKEGRPDKRKSREGWRLWWLKEARQNCSTYDPIAKAGPHLTPSGQSAVNVLVTSSELRDALNRGRSELSCGLGMLLICEVISGGYSLEVAATKATHDAIKAARTAAYKNGIGKTAPDHKKAREACCTKAQCMWADDESLRIGAVAKSLWAMLKNNRADFQTYEKIGDLPSTETIKTWLKEAAQAGTLNIPPAASQPGRPRRSKE